MFAERLVEKLPLRPTLLKPVLVSVTVAFLVSLGTVLILAAMSMEINAAIPAALGAIAGSLAAARVAEKNHSQSRKHN